MVFAGNIGERFDPPELDNRCPHCGRAKHVLLLQSGGQVYVCLECDTQAIQDAARRSQIRG